MKDKIFITSQGQIEAINISAGYYETSQLFGENYVILKDIAYINPKREKPVFELSEKVPYVGLPETDKGEIQEIKYRPFKEVKGRNVFKKGDILFARIEPSIFNKKYIYVDEKFDLDFAYTSTEFYIIEAKKGVNNKYIYNLLFNDETYNQFSGKTTGSTGRRRLDRNTFENIKIPLPPLEIQNQIVEKMNRALEIKKQKEKEAKELLESIDDFVLNELGIEYEEVEEKKIFGINLSELGESKRIDVNFNNPKFIIQEKQIKNGKYDLVKIGEKFQYINGFAFSSKDYQEEGTKLLTIKNITKTGVTFKNVTYLPENYLEKYNTFEIQKNDILFAMTGATIGKACIFESEEKVLLNQRCGAIRTDTENPLFLYTVLNLDFYKTEIFRNSGGGAQPNISHNEILDLEIPLPPLSIQEKISKEVKSRIEKAGILEKEAREIYESGKMEVEGIILGS
ncbi:MAG: restriction endonuclease subunit S [Candidatus Gracilibacteria bacterium]|nr:restriction endonuclease subunit S [Candidatus Gracilibacteria bacterium]